MTRKSRVIEKLFVQLRRNLMIISPWPKKLLQRKRLLKPAKRKSNVRVADSLSLDAGSLSRRFFGGAGKVFWAGQSL
jgi:hypothetical protein